MSKIGALKNKALIPSHDITDATKLRMKTGLSVTCASCIHDISLMNTADQVLWRVLKRLHLLFNIDLSAKCLDPLLPVSVIRQVVPPYHRYPARTYHVAKFIADNATIDLHEASPSLATALSGFPSPFVLSATIPRLGQPTLSNSDLQLVLYELFYIARTATTKLRSGYLTVCENGRHKPFFVTSSGITASYENNSSLCNEFGGELSGFNKGMRHDDTRANLVAKTGGAGSWLASSDRHRVVKSNSPTEKEEKVEIMPPLLVYYQSTMLGCSNVSLDNSTLNQVHKAVGARRRRALLRLKVAEKFNSILDQMAADILMELLDKLHKDPRFSKNIPKALIPRDLELLSNALRIEFRHLNLKATELL